MRLEPELLDSATDAVPPRGSGRCPAFTCTSWPFLGFLHYRIDKEKVTDSLIGQSCWCVGPQLELSEGEAWSPFLDPRDRTVKSACQRDGEDRRADAERLQHTTDLVWGLLSCALAGSLWQETLSALIVQKKKPTSNILK